jgi:hypothetical protein
MAKFKIGQKLKNIVGTVAPMLGGSLGGPLGGMAGKMIQNALGVDSESAALSMLESDPDALLKLKQAEIDFDKRMRELDIDEEKLHQADRASARNMAIQTTLIPQIVLAALFITGYFTIVGLFFSSTLEVPMSDAFNVLLGVMTGAIPMILQFFFGSSSGSAKKTDLMAKRDV